MNIKHRLFHKWYPTLISLALAILTTQIPTLLDFTYETKDRSAFLSASMSLGAILTGFIATSQAILMTLPEAGLLSRLRSSGYIHDLVNCFAAAMIGATFFVALSLVGFFITTLNSQFYYIWFFSLSYCALTFFRVSKLMMLILKYGAK